MPARSPKTNKPPIAIAAQDIRVTFEDHVVLDGISFEIPVGTMAAIIGPNGSGKTTLVKTLLGLITPTSGTANFFGHHLHESRGEIGYVPQRFAFDKTFPMTVAEFLALNKHHHTPKDAGEEAIKEVGLTPLILERRLGDLSGGQLQRVLVASAILNHPSILFLDEPATGIDVAGEEALYDVLAHLNAEHKTTILMVSHDIAMVSKLVDTVICINKKLLCVGPPKSMLTDSRLSHLYGETAHPFAHHHV